MGRRVSEELGSSAAGFQCFPSAAASLQTGRGDSCDLAVVAGDAFCRAARAPSEELVPKATRAVPQRCLWPCTHPGDAPSSGMLLRCPAALSALLLFCSRVRRFPSTALASLALVMKVEGTTIRSS